MVRIKKRIKEDSVIGLTKQVILLFFSAFQLKFLSPVTLS